ncbi:hypothetical protein UlMin_004406 [Ulmus minor]
MELNKQFPKIAEVLGKPTSLTRGLRTFRMEEITGPFSLLEVPDEGEFKEIENNEPQSYKEAISCKDCSYWIKAMKIEMDSLLKNRTWTLVKKPEKQKIVECNWVYKIKKGTTADEKKRYKARLVAKGFT